MLLRCSGWGEVLHPVTQIFSMYLSASRMRGSSGGLPPAPCFPARHRSDAVSPALGSPEPLPLSTCSRTRWSENTLESSVHPAHPRCHPSSVRLPRLPSTSFCLSIYVSTYPSITYQSSTCISLV